MSSKVCVGSNVTLIVNPVSKIIRYESALDFIDNLKNRKMIKS